MNEPDEPDPVIPPLDTIDDNQRVPPPRRPAPAGRTRSRRLAPSPPSAWSPCCSPPAWRDVLLIGLFLQFRAVWRGLYDGRYQGDPGRSDVPLLPPRDRCRRRPPPARTPLRAAQEQAGVPVGRWMGCGLAALGLTPGEEVTEAQLWNFFGERGRHPYADRIEAERLAAGDSPKKAFKAGALGSQVTVTGVDFVFRPQPTIYLLWAFGDDETWRVIEATHERAIERVLEWIENEVTVIRYGKVRASDLLPDWYCCRTPLLASPWGRRGSAPLPSRASGT